MKILSGNLAAFALLLSLTAAPIPAAAPATRPTTAPASPALALRPAVTAAALVALRKSSLSDDLAESLAALRQLTAAGEAGRALLREVAPQLLTRDAATIEAEAAAAPAELPKLRSAEADIAPARAGALRAIGGMTADPKAQKAARQNYQRLSAVQARLAAGYGRQAKVVNAMNRRAESLECLALLKAGGAAAASPAEENRVNRLAEQALGMPPDAAVGFTRGALEPPKEPGRRGLWFYLSCRRVEVYNRSIEPALNAAESAHARRVNAYREMLGLLPYELDPRLIQSARRHSKEMIDLWYFSHYSPTESERNPWRRMARAGYSDGANENITVGSWSGEEAFWRLFNSPDHHRTWVNPAGTALGVGKWGNAWTEDIGAGPRLMTAGAERRTGAAVRGEELKPQPADAPRRHPRDLSEMKFYDPGGREVGKASVVLSRKADPRDNGREATGAGKAGDGGNPGDAGKGTIEVEVKDGKAGGTVRWVPGRGTTGPSQ